MAAHIDNPNIFGTPQLDGDSEIFEFESFNSSVSYTPSQGLGHLCVQRVIWTPRTLFFDSLDSGHPKV